MTTGRTIISENGGGRYDVASKPPLAPRQLLPGIFAFPPNPDSFGGISYLVTASRHLFMVDVPEYIEQNLNFIRERGIPEFIFLTHRDDVADAELFRKFFGAQLIIHKSEKYVVSSPDITFDDSLEIGDTLIIHTPGHSPGSSSLYCPELRVLFTGDHITANGGKPVAEDFSWTYDYELQLESARQLMKYDFDFILAGHGGRWLIRNAKEELEKFLSSFGSEKRLG